MFNPDINIYLVLLTIAVTLVALYLEVLRPSLVFFLASLFLILLNILPVEVFLTGFSNRQIATILLLIVITSSLKRHFGIEKSLDRIFGPGGNLKIFLLKLMGISAGASAIINNTPIVAMLTPYVYDWGKRNNVAVSKLLIPLSFATILGGMITLIGTSTNLVLNGLLEENNQELLSFTDFLGLGILVSIAGVLYMLTMGIHLLPENMDPLGSFKEKTREYVVETKISPSSNLAGKTVEHAGLRNLRGVFLVEILRNGNQISPVSPSEELHSNDLLFFAGNVDTIIDLVQSDNGIELPKNDHLAGGKDISVMEAVVPVNSSLSGKVVRESNFRERYNAAIIAIHRNGERLQGKIGNMRLSAGDLLLISAGERFFKNDHVGKDLYAVSNISKKSGISPGKKYLAVAISAISIAMAIAGVLSLFTSLLVIAATLAATNLVKVEDVRRDVDLDLIFVLVFSLALGNALVVSGAAEMVSMKMIGLLMPLGVIGVVGGLFLLTIVLTSFVSNVAAVSISFPIAMAVISQLQLESKPIYLSIAFAASAAFLTPIGYQTNLMVYGPGGYTYKDFFKVGFPLTIIYSVVVFAYLIFMFDLI